MQVSYGTFQGAITRPEASEHLLAALLTISFSHDAGYMRFQDSKAKTRHNPVTALPFESVSQRWSCLGSLQEP